MKRSPRGRKPHPPTPSLCLCSCLTPPNSLLKSPAMPAPIARFVETQWQSDQCCPSLKRSPCSTSMTHFEATFAAGSGSTNATSAVRVMVTKGSLTSVGVCRSSFCLCWRYPLGRLEEPLELPHAPSTLSCFPPSLLSGSALLVKHSFYIRSQ